MIQISINKVEARQLRKILEEVPLMGFKLVLGVFMFTDNME